MRHNFFISIQWKWKKFFYLFREIILQILVTRTFEERKDRREQRNIICAILSGHVLQFIRQSKANNSVIVLYSNLRINLMNKFRRCYCALYYNILANQILAAVTLSFWKLVYLECRNIIPARLGISENIYLFEELYCTTN